MEIRTGKIFSPEQMKEKFDSSEGDAEAIKKLKNDFIPLTPRELNTVSKYNDRARIDWAARKQRKLKKKAAKASKRYNRK